MASIHNRNNKWQVRIARKGLLPEVKTFASRQDAERWSRSVQTEMDMGHYVSRSEAESSTLKDIIERYIVEVCPSKRGGIDEAIRLRATSRTKLAKLSMAAVTSRAVASYRDDRLKQVMRGTVIRELAYLSSIIDPTPELVPDELLNPLLRLKKPLPPVTRMEVSSSF